MMIRYIAFLRGINISGKNKIPMAELKAGFESIGFQNVKTHLNTGNVLFSCEETEVCKITSAIELMVQNRFSLDIPILVLPKETLEDILNHTPDWWDNGNKEIYNNLIFILPPTSAEEVIQEIGMPCEGIEWIKSYHDTIFWSFLLKDYRKTNWWSKTANSSVSGKLTIRTANTLKKLVVL